MGVGEACPTLVSLRQMTASAATVIKPQLRPGVALDLQLPPEGLHVHIDATRIGQVIINLAQNASRFTSQGAVSVVCSYDRGAGSGGDDADAASAADGHDGPMGMVTVMVRDSGVGLTDKAKQTLLTAVQPASGVDVGCGIGLYLAQKLLVSMGSTLEFRSPWTERHAGTEFKFSVAVREGASLPPPPPDPAQQRDGTARDGTPERVTLSRASELRVLIADDMSSNRKLLARALARCMSSQLVCNHAATAEAAIEAAGGGRFDVIFMDENFSVDENALTGSDAVRAIRAAEQAAEQAASASEHHRAVIVSCTGYAAEASVATDHHEQHSRFFEAGCDAVWGKPLPSHVDGSMQKELARILPDLVVCGAVSGEHGGVAVREGASLPPPPPDPAQQRDGTARDGTPERVTLSRASELRVLIADDMSSNRKLLARALARCMSSQLVCNHAATAEAAIEAAGGGRFDVIFMDENFSVDENALTGSDAVRAIRAAEQAAEQAASASEHHRAVIVSCTGYAAEASVATDHHEQHSRFFEAGCDAVWGKPLPSHVDGSMQKELARILPDLVVCGAVSGEHGGEPAVYGSG